MVRQKEAIIAIEASLVDQKERRQSPTTTKTQRPKKGSPIILIA
jgi:hypothetical protein